MVNRNGNQRTVVALVSGGTCWNSDTWEFSLLENLKEMPRPNMKLACLWALEKIVKQGLLTFIHKGHALSVVGLLEGEMAVARQ